MIGIQQTMKHLTFIIGFISLFYSVGNAKAHCFADIVCSNSNGRIFNNNTNWANRTNGKRWFQNQGNHRAECNSLGANYFNSMNIEELAKNNGMCGKITCKGTSWIGTSNKKGELGPKTVEVKCDDTQTEDSISQSDYQYASKVVCGKLDYILHSGLYKTVINIHNPSYDNVDFRYKFAMADNGKDGKISKFYYTSIGADGAQYFNCRNFSKILGSNGNLDGFFVIESDKPLDVISYYTGGDKILKTLDVEKTYERTVKQRKWSCGNVEDKRGENFANINNWELVNGNIAQVSEYRYNNVNYPINNFGVYKHDVDIWLSNTAVINNQQKEGDYTYKFKFCICKNDYPGKASIDIISLRADNSVKAYIDGNFFINGASHNQLPTGSGSTTITATGTHTLELRSKNYQKYHAVGIRGYINITNGYLGECR